MKRFFLRSLLFLSPFLIVIGVELFILPIDFFTFRVWEAVLIKEFDSILPGHFYPRMEIEKVETGGDLTHDPSDSVPKKVRWMTDRYGFRKNDSGGINPLVVIVGDSNIAGSRLTQKEMLSEVLEERLKVPVYPYAPVGSINTFLKDPRFIKDPPKVVIVSIIEREILNMPFPKLSQRREKFFSFYEWRDKIKQTTWVQSVGVLLDRLFKMNMLYYFRARIGKETAGNSPPFPSKFGRMFFLQGATANQEVSDDDFRRVIETIESYGRVFKKKGIRFIFLPIPNKENIYHDCLPGSPSPIFLHRVIQELKRRGIDIVDTQRAFEDEYRIHSALLYFMDDSHWNERAVQLAAALAAQLLQEER
ncbi:MAG TPA: hypothetical protein VMV04_25105 [Thermodesulfobacteriota bacterium]|nr:hypothetical protein [Thermodesulfobacteriota bacterium]